MGAVNGRLHDQCGKTTSSASHDSDISVSTASVDFTVTPPISRKCVSFVDTDAVARVGESSEESDACSSGTVPLILNGQTCRTVPAPGPPGCCCCCCSDPVDPGRTSPGNDLGYHTLISRQTPTPLGQSRPPPPAPLLGPLSPCPRSSPRPRPPRAPPDTEQLFAAAFKGKRATRGSPFDRLSDDVILKIFSYLSTSQLCMCARVCRRWYFLAWEPRLWGTVELAGERTNTDRALKTLMRLLSRDSPSVCLTVERVLLNGCSRLSDRGISYIARCCSELRHLELRGCVGVTNAGVLELVAHCVNLEHLDLTGCQQVNCVGFSQSTGGSSSSRTSAESLQTSRSLYIQHLDLTDCHSLQDTGLKIAVRGCPQLQHLYLRRCVLLTDAALRHVACYCMVLRELSVSDCVHITDFGMYELAKLGPNLRYLSVAKCDQISDAGIKQIARHCYKLRYLNVRGCEAVSDDSMEVLARSCPRLRALDIGKCDVTDHGLKVLSEHCPNLKKLSVKSCEMITDKGIQTIAYYCRGLQQLNIQDCQITLDGYRTVKKFCKRCIIEHTNPGFY